MTDTRLSHPVGTGQLTAGNEHEATTIEGALWSRSGRCLGIEGRGAGDPTSHRSATLDVNRQGAGSLRERSEGRLPPGGGPPPWPAFSQAVFSFRPARVVTLGL